MENLKSLEGKTVRVFEATYNHSSFAAPICIAGKCTLVDVENGWIVLDDDKVFNLQFLNRVEVVKESSAKKRKEEEKKKKADEKKAKKEREALKKAERKAKRDARKSARFAKKVVNDVKKKSSKKEEVEVIIDKPEAKDKLDLDEDEEFDDVDEIEDDKKNEEDEHDEFYVGEDE